jgi:hypothetical protein
MRDTRLIGVSLVVLGVLLHPARAAAQIDNPSWGLNVGFAPVWRVPSQLKSVVDAETLDIHGREFQIGLVRGTTLGNEWGISLVHKRLSKNSKIALRQSNGVVSVVTDDAEMLGFEVNQFFSFLHIGQAQIGVNASGGLAQMRGFVTGSVVPASGTAIVAPIGFPEVFELAGFKVRAVPLGRLELAGVGHIGDRVKVRVGGGFNMPGIELVNVSVSWLMGRD